MTTLPWYIAGPLLGLMIPVILILRGKQLGVSSVFRYAGSKILPKNSYFKYQKEKDSWQLHFAIGLFIAAVVLLYFENTAAVEIDSSKLYGQQAQEIYLVSNWAVFLIGGIMVGFGARYAGGCTAGHCLMGNSLLAPSSLISTIAFFLGGLFVSHVIIPNIL